MATMRNSDRAMGLRPFLPLLIGIIFLLSAAAGAGAASDKDRQRLEDASNRAARIEQQQERRSGQISEVQASARAAGIAEMKTLARLQRTQREKRSLVLRLGQANRDLKEAEVRERRAVRILSDRLIAIYRNPRPDYIGFLLGADSFEELQTTAEYLRTVHDADQSAADRVRGLRIEIAERHREIIETKTELDRKIASLESEQEAFVAARKRAKIAVEELMAAQKKGSGSLDAARDEVTRIRAEINGTPLYGGGPYAIPTYIVMCESGGDYRALNPSSGAGGAYQILPSTWRAYGGKGLPHLASKAEQDRIAAMIWRDSGSSAWVCA
jgi:septal ring factor EnvC (AmiA/AmiB activator)